MRLELVVLVAAWIGVICLFVVVPWTAIRVVSAVLEPGEARAGRRRVASARDSPVAPTETALVTNDEPSAERAEANATRLDTEDPYNRGTKT